MTEPAASPGRGEPLLRVEGLRVYFPGTPDPVRAIDGVDLTVHDGETLALVGESGCGKSTLARAVMGLVAPSAGTVSFLGSELPPLGSAARRRLCRQIQMVFQDPDASLNPRMTLAASVGEPLELHERLGRAERDRRVAELFERVGLDPSLRHRYPHELSGGQRQRACIARALAVRPRLVICDEAVSALDVSVRSQILNLLTDLKKDFGLSYLFITHDLGVVRHVADRVVVMYLGQIVEVEETEALFRSPHHPYTRALLAAVPSLDAAAPDRRQQPPEARGDLPSPTRPPTGCRFHPRCPEAFERCSREAPALYPVREGGLSRCFASEPSAGEGDRGAKRNGG